MAPRLACAYLGVVVLLARFGVSGAAVPTCPAKKFLSCIQPVTWQLPNITSVLLSSNTPALTVLGFPGKVDLRATLPWNDAVTLTYRRTNHSLYDCQVPIFAGSKLLSYASSPSSPYQKTFSTCLRSPMSTGRQNYYVSGAFFNISALSTRATRGLEQVQAWKTFYLPVAPALSMCLTVNPCLMNVFLGISYLQKPINVQAQGASVEVKLQSYFYSFGTNVLPPAWRSATPSFWVMNPSAFNFTGFMYPVEQLTSPTGRTFIKGPLDGNGVNTVTLPCATLNLGRQLDAWVMWRDQSRVAVSYSLAAGPTIRLWDKIDLTLWLANGAKITNMQLMTRWSTCQFWLGGPDENATLWRVVNQIPALGSIMALVYQDPGNSATNANRIASFDVYLAGSKGASVRVGMRAGSYPLTRAARLRMGQAVLTTPHNLIFTAMFGADAFTSGVTLQQGTYTTPIDFCANVEDCPPEYAYCDANAGVCLPLANANVAEASTTAVSAASVTEPVASALAFLGESCSSAVPCDEGMRCTTQGHCRE